MVCRFLSIPNSGGISPQSLLKLKFLCKVVTSAGRAIIDAYKYVRLHKRDSSTGIPPVNWLFFNFLVYVSSSHVLHCATYSFFRFTRFPIVVGIFPVNRLFSRSLMKPKTWIWQVVYIKVDAQADNPRKFSYFWRNTPIELVLVQRPERKQLIEVNFWSEL